MIPSYVDLRMVDNSIRLFKDKNTKDIFREDEITDWEPMEPYTIPPMLRQTGTGRVFPFTIFLAKRKDMESYFPPDTDKATAPEHKPQSASASDPAMMEMMKNMQEQLAKLTEDNLALRTKNRELAAGKQKKAKKRVARTRAEVDETISKIMGDTPQAEA